MLIKDGKLNLVNLVLMMYVFSIIFFSDGSIILKAVRVLFSIMCILHIIKNRKIYIDKYVMWMLFFAIFCSISISWAISKENAKNILSTLIFNDICIFFIINLLYEDKRRVQLIINSIIFSSIVMGINIIIEHGPMVYISGIRGIEGEISANTMGMIAAISCVLSLYQFKIQKKYKYRILYIIVLMLNLMIMILSASRKAVLFFLIPIIIYYILNSKNALRVVKNIVVSIVICILVFFLILKVPFLYNSVGHRVETMINGFLGVGESDASTTLRLRMIKWGMEWFAKKPYFGYGINNYRNLLGTKNTSFGVEGAYAHNNYVELLVDVGLIGTIIYYYIYIVMLYQGLKNWKRLGELQIIFLGILIVCAINDYGMVSYYAKFNQLLFAVSWIILCKSEIFGKNLEEKNI